MVRYCAQLVSRSASLGCCWELGFPLEHDRNSTGVELSQGVVTPTHPAALVQQIREGLFILANLVLESDDSHLKLFHAPVPS